MTRKRFIKILMSRGETPRSARAIARLYNASNKPYKKAYLNYLPEASLKESCDNLAKAMRGFGLEVRHAAKSFKKLAEALKINDQYRPD